MQTDETSKLIYLQKLKKISGDSMKRKNKIKGED